MKQHDAFKGSYLRVDDLNGKRCVLMMSGVEMRDIGGESSGEEKPVLSFRNTDKELVLNKTNWNSIVEVTGHDDSDDWSGHKIVLTPARTEFRGKQVPYIRVDIDESIAVNNKAQRRATPSKEVEPPLVDGAEDEGLGEDPIPF